MRIFETDLAIDLGTVNTLIYSAKHGVLLNEPSIVAVHAEKGGDRMLGTGSEAKRMWGRSPAAIQIVRPVRTGVVAEQELTVRMLKSFLSKVVRGSLRVFRPKVIVGVPNGASEVERRAIREAVSAVASKTTLIDETLAAAIGAGLPVDQPHGSMIVDIGGGTTDIAVISMSRVVCGTSLRIAGDALYDAIITHLRQQRQLRVGDTTAELVKIAVGSAHPDYDGQEMQVAGQDVATGLPRNLVVSGAEVRRAIEPLITPLIGGIRQVLEDVPPELLGDVLDTGVILSGGGAFLKGLDRRVMQEVGLPTRVAPNALSAVVEGAGKFQSTPQRFSCGELARH